MTATLATAYEEASHLVVADAFGMKLESYFVCGDSGEVHATIHDEEDPDGDAKGAYLMAGSVGVLLAGLPLKDVLGSEGDDYRARKLARELGYDEASALRRWRYLATATLVAQWDWVERIASKLRAGATEIELPQ